ncbi:Rrf2 family transcriptional regulator [Pararhizobium sp. PWRC1-1]|uniref:Rrf2 family transcriptional regulator n=1 Tax=Pararhizobium sp. PWRC1-1 TaxID=2804566 RepID=UPI003CE8497F
MRGSSGPSQAICAVVLIAQLDGEIIAASALARLLGVSKSYLLKRLQSLSGAGILTAMPGTFGGYRLSKSAETITVLDVLDAIEGKRRRPSLKRASQSGAGIVPNCVEGALEKAECAHRIALEQVSIRDLVKKAEAKTAT